jgi:hypothetical protein
MAMLTRGAGFTAGELASGGRSLWNEWSSPEPLKNDGLHSGVLNLRAHSAKALTQTLLNNPN